MSNKFLDCYMRVSSNEQRDEGNSLSVQEDMGKDVSNKLGLIFRPHMEGSRSSTIHYREVLEELKYKISKGEVKNIWIQDRSRLFRDLIEGLLFRRDFLEKFKVSLYEGSTPTRIHLDSPEENLQYNILMTFNQYENQQRSHKSQLGKIHKLKTLSPTKSVYMGGTSLFGYINIDKIWTIQKEESKWVKFIFDSYEKGKTIKQVKDLLDRNGVEPRRTGNGLWNTGTIHKMLMNKTYTGLHHIHQKKIDYTFSVKVPKIIKVGQFRKVQKLLQRHQHFKDNNKKHFSLLEEFLVCECGKRMGSRHLKTTSSLGYKVNTRTYYCLSSQYDWKSGNERVCKNKKSLQMDSLNEYVLDFVKEKVSQSNILKDNFKKQVLEDKFQRMKDIKETEKQYENKIQKLQKEIDEIENKIVDMEVSKIGMKDTTIIDKVIAKYIEVLDGRKTVCEEIEKNIDDLGQDKNWLNWVEKYGETLELNTSNEEKQKDFLKGIVKQITIHSEYGFDRNEKSIQKGHSVDFRFTLKIVDDEYEVLDKTTKPRSYRVKQGKDRYKSDGVMRFINTRVRSKKKIKSEVENEVSLFHQSKPLRNCRVDLTDEITLPKYTHYLCFSVKVRTNKFIYFPLEKYTPQQQEIFNKILSLHNSGLGYRKISYYLNSKGINTHKGKQWGNNNVYSVLKRHKEREERIEYMNKEYEPQWSKMEIQWERNI